MGWACIAAAQTPTLLKDINTLPADNGSTAGSNPRFLTNAGGILYFTATDNNRTTSLWKSNGTTNGTTKVRDLPGTAYSLTAVGNMLFFVADDASSGYELWRSNGTAAGTVRLKDIYPGIVGSMPSGLVAINNLLYFVAEDPIMGGELWCSDGTTVGTRIVKDIAFGASTSNPQQLTNVNGTLYFSADNGVNGQELWKSDGTTNGTVLVRDINTGAVGSQPQQLTNVNGMLYFVANTTNNGYELWKSNGTNAGTTLVRDIWPGAPNAMPHFLTPIGNTLYFAANDGTQGIELWKSDGTSSGTTLVLDIVAGSRGGEPRFLKNIGGVLYFSATNSVMGHELWKSNGTAAGTVMVKNIRLGGDWSNSDPMAFTNSKGIAYFVAYDDTNGQELWKTDGTEQGTWLLKQLKSGPPSSAIRSITTIGDTLYFSAQDSLKGTEVRRLNPCKIVAKILNKPTAKICGGSTITLQTQPNDCEGINLKWSSTLTTVTGTEASLTFKLPEVLLERKYKIVFTASYGKDIAKDSVEVTVLPRPLIQLTSRDTVICHYGPFSLVQMVKNYSSFSNPAWYKTAIGGATVANPVAVNLDSTQSAYFLIANSPLGCKDTAQVTIRVREIPESLGSIRVVLEGAYEMGTGRMHHKLNTYGLLPGQTPVGLEGLNPTPPLQPYSGFPWFYNGRETGGNYKYNITDWVLVSLRTQRDDPSTTVFKAAALLQNDGLVPLVTGCPGRIADLQWYYVGVEHRNHVSIVAEEPSLFINGGFFYDFTIHQSYIPSDRPGIGQKFLDGRYVMYAGDIERTAGYSEINASDLSRWERDNGKFGRYLPTDLNLDGEVNALDKIVWAINNGLFSATRF